MTAEPSPPQLDVVPEWVAKVRAIAIDTNAIGKGTFDIEDLKLLAHKATQHNELELWVAEPVVWEWAEHLRVDRAKLNEARTKLVAAGIEVASQPADIEDALQFVQSGLQSLGDHVKIIPIGPVAVEALKDQILVRPPGERFISEGRPAKSGKGKSVKTGAADSAIYRAYLHQAQENVDTYVLLSGDSDVQKAHDAWEIDSVKVFRGIKTLDKDVFRVMPASTERVIKCASYLREHLERIDLTSFESLSNLVDWELDPKTLLFSGFGDKVLVGLSEARWDRKTRYVSAEAWVLTDVFGPQVTYDSVGEPHIESATQRLYEDTLVRLSVTFVLESGEVTNLTVGEVNFAGVNVGVEDVYEDDGPLIIMENLNGVPGLEDLDWPAGFFEPAETSYEVDGDTLELAFSGSAADEWTLTASYRGEAVEVTAMPRYDGLDLGDGITFSGTAELSTDSRLAWHHPSLAVNALVMNTPKTQ